jgi:hypothetical protein
MFWRDLMVVSEIEVGDCVIKCRIASYWAD